MNSSHEFICFGALTAKSYAFVSRSWELERVLSFDFTDSYASTLVFFYRGLELIRVLPFTSSRIEWISDRARFFYDGFKLQRLTKPFLRLGFSRYLIGTSWFTAFSYFSVFALTRFLPFQFFESRGFTDGLSGRTVGFGFVNGLADFEQLGLARFVFSRFGLLRRYSARLSPSLCVDWRYDYFALDADLRAHLIPFSDNFGELEAVDFFFLGFNPRFEQPVLNISFRNRVARGLSNVLTFGSFSHLLNYKTFDMGSNVSSFELFITGRHRFCRMTSHFLRPLVFVVGMSNFRVSSAFAVNELKFLILFVARFANLKVCYLPLYQELQSLLESELGFSQPALSVSPPPSVLYIFENNELDLNPNLVDLVVYQGYQAEHSANFADLIFPTFSYFEDTFTGWKFDFSKLEVVPFKRAFASDLQVRRSRSVLLNLLRFISYRVRESRVLSFSAEKGRFIIRAIWGQVYNHFLFMRATDLFANLAYFGSLSFFLLAAYNNWLNFSGVATRGEFILISRFFYFRNLFFLPIIKRQHFRGLNPRCFVYLSSYASDIYRCLFQFNSEFFSQLKSFFDLSVMYAQHVVKHLYFGFVLTPFKRVVMRYTLAKAFTTYSTYIRGGLRALQSSFYTFLSFEGFGFVNWTLSFPSFVDFARLASNKLVLFFFRYDVTLLTYSDTKLSSAARFSRPLFLKSRYFLLANFNFL